MLILVRPVGVESLSLLLSRHMMQGYNESWLYKIYLTPPLPFYKFCVIEDVPSIGANMKNRYPECLTGVLGLLSRIGSRP
jgi:hypothetical protein